MRKAIAALIAVALTVLTLGTPGQASPQVKTDVIAEAAQIEGTELGLIFPEISDEDFLALPIKDGKVSGAFRSNFDDQWVSPGSALKFIPQHNLTQGEEIRCAWFYESEKYPWDPIEVNQECTKPLVVDESDAGRYFFVLGWYELDGKVTALLETDSAPRVALSSVNSTVAIAEFEPLWVDKESSVRVDLARPAGTEIVEEASWSASAIDRAGKNLGKLNNGYGTRIDWSLRYKPSHFQYQEQVKLEVIVHSDKYEPFAVQLPLGVVDSSYPAQVQTQVPYLEMYGDQVHSFPGSTDAMENGSSYTFLVWEVGGKDLPKTDVQQLDITDAMSGRKVRAKITTYADRYKKHVATTEYVTLPKIPVPFEITNANYGGSARVGSALIAPKVKALVDGIDVKYQWYVEGKPVAGANSTKFSLNGSHYEDVVQVRVTFSSAYYIKQEFMFPYKQVLDGKLSLTKEPTATGSVFVGNTLTAKAGVWSPSPSITNYYWFADGKALNKVGSSTLKLTPELLGKTIKLRTVVQKKGYQSGIREVTLGKVAKSTAKISGKLSTTSIRKGQSAKLAVTVKVPGTSKPTGKVTVTVGKKAFTKTVSSSHSGNVTVYLYGLSTGSSQAVKVKFTPSSSTAKFSKSSATTTVGKITVKK